MQPPQFKPWINYSIFVLLVHSATLSYPSLWLFAMREKLITKQHVSSCVPSESLVFVWIFQSVESERGRVASIPVAFWPHNFGAFGFFCSVCAACCGVNGWTFWLLWMQCLSDWSSANLVLIRKWDHFFFLSLVNSFAFTWNSFWWMCYFWSAWVCVCTCMCM